VDRCGFVKDVPTSTLSSQEVAQSRLSFLVLGAIPEGLEELDRRLKRLTLHNIDGG